MGVKQHTSLVSDLLTLLNNLPEKLHSTGETLNIRISARSSPGVMIVVMSSTRKKISSIHRRGTE